MCAAHERGLRCCSDFTENLGRSGYGERERERESVAGLVGGNALRPPHTRKECPEPDRLESWPSLFNACTLSQVRWEKRRCTGNHTPADERPTFGKWQKITLGISVGQILGARLLEYWSRSKFFFLASSMGIVLKLQKKKFWPEKSVKSIIFKCALKVFSPNANFVN